ncbi:MAG: HAD-IIIA family hydrolase [Candidatus Omnitrophota bacterium]
MSDKLVFIDRDGVINEDPGGWTEYGYVTRLEELRILPGAAEALGKLSRAGYRNVIISNQQGVGKGYFSQADLDGVTSEVRRAVEEAGGRIDGVYYCTHRKEEDCPCRKPKEGLFLIAREELGIKSFEGKFYIGDTQRDIEAGKRAGLRTILVLSGKSSREDAEEWEHKPDHICGSLLEAAEFIIREEDERRAANKKVIVLYSTAGMGHKKAAMAIAGSFREKRPDIECEMIDVLDYASRVYRFLYLDFYVFLMSRAKAFWGFLYYFSDNPLVDILTRKVRGILDHIGIAGVGGVLAKKSPDAVIATHFFLPSVAWILKRNRGFTAKLCTLITDYGPHRIWFSGHMDRYFVGADGVKDEMARRGIPPEKIDVTGIPVTAEFRGGLDAAGLRARYGILPGKKTVFLMSGGFGVGPIGEILGSLNSCRADIQVIVVCGHNKASYNKINVLKEKLGYSVILFGFTDKVAELMAVSDLMITKAGGISVTEAMDMRLPMILYGSIPGQETWNEGFLVGSGAAKKAASIDEIRKITDDVLSSDAVYDGLKQGVDKIRKPDAAERIVDAVINLLGSSSKGQGSRQRG